MRPTRRTFLTHTGQLAGAAAILGPFTSSFTRTSTMVTSMTEPNLLRDTMNGFVAFVVPGPDEYSVAQGVSTPEPGAVDAQATDFLIGALDLSAPFAPGFASTVASILNDIARQVNPDASGPFSSDFARLSFGEKAAVLSVMEGLEPLRPLAGVLDRK